MQERRATIRIRHRGYLHYAFPGPSEPRDGRLVNVSERGVGLLLQDTPQHGEWVIVTFSLPGSRDWLTATGVVRWASRALNRRWYQAGLSWMPLEDEARGRLSQFLSAPPPAATVAESARLGSRAPQSEVMHRPWTIPAIVSAAVAVLLALWLVWTLMQSYRLQREMAQRARQLLALEQQKASLQEGLGRAQAALASTRETVSQLDRQAERLAEQTQQFTTDVQRVQMSYLALEVERDQLRWRVRELQAAPSASRPVPAEALQRAIRDAIAARQPASERR